ncbi:HTH domain-containing protein [Candidatus Micrarchaeota archaeon]|nr:HTH domain-containing protein [Candidatus Micrarchaeota archaeon]
MKKNEWVYRELLYQFIEKKNNHFTQLALAKKISISISTVNNALKPLARMGAVDIRKMNFHISDIKKLLFYWASNRNIKDDIIYQTHVEMSPVKIEKDLWKKVKFTAYSGYRFKFRDAAADYSEVYAYADNKTLPKIKKRFPENRGQSNLHIIRADGVMNNYPDRDNVTIGELFVDLWSLGGWYAKAFSNDMERKIADIVGFQIFYQV